MLTPLIRYVPNATDTQVFILFWNCRYPFEWRRALRRCRGTTSGRQLAVDHVQDFTDVRDGEM